MGVRCGVFNIGAEGQIYLGGLGATLTAFMLAGLPKIILIPCCIIGGAVFGAVWGAIPGYLKAKRNVNEVITTLLMNYIAIHFVHWTVNGPLKEPNATFPRTATLPDGAILPVLVPRTQLHIGILIALFFAFAVWFLLSRTTLGFQLRTTGSSPNTAFYAGMNVQKLTILALAISGGLAGIGGAVEIMGVHHCLLEGFSPGYGFDAIAVALLGATTVPGVILSGTLFGMLRAGANTMQRTVGIPTSLVFVIQGMAVLMVLAATAISYMRSQHIKKQRSREAAFKQADGKGDL